MYKKSISILLLSTMASSYPLFAASEQTEVLEQVIESAEQVTESEQVTQALPSGPGWQVIRSLQMGNSGKYVHMVLIDQKKYTDKTIYSSAINRLCQSEEEFCRVRFWSQERFIPEKVSVTPAQYKEQRAEYLFNQTAGIHQLLWSCSVDPDRSHCIEQ